MALATLLDNACRWELVRSAVNCKKPHDFNSINIIVLIIDLIFIYFVSDHGISGIMPFEVSIIRNKWTLRRPFISDNGHLIGQTPIHNACLLL